MDRVERAIADLAVGKAVVVVDDADRENEDDLIFATERARAKLMAFTVRLGVRMRDANRERANRLELPPMYYGQPGPAKHRLCRHGASSFTCVAGLM
jgi:3,4-dihydroxy 2-butanone 4-phosphate synthase/GTP cyclohydrolase II